MQGDEAGDPVVAAARLSTMFTSSAMPTLDISDGIAVGVVVLATTGPSRPARTTTPSPAGTSCVPWFQALVDLDVATELAGRWSVGGHRVVAGDQYDALLWFDVVAAAKHDLWRGSPLETADPVGAHREDVGALHHPPAAFTRGPGSAPTPGGS